jgi:hypothetical protein
MGGQFSLFYHFEFGMMRYIFVSRQALITCNRRIVGIESITGRTEGENRSRLK